MKEESRKSEDVNGEVDSSLRFTTVLKKKGASQATLTVAVRVRPLARRDRQLGAVSLTRVMDEKMVVVLDPKETDGRKSNPQDAIRQQPFKATPGQGVKDREKQYMFDRAFEASSTNQQVYKHVVQGMISGLLRGLNATVFAYGATGSGKTHTMVGTEDDPGLMVLSMRDVFRHISHETDKTWKVTCSYLEVYNEEIYDLLAPSSKPLDLREDPDLGPQVAGLRKIEVKTPQKIFSLLKGGNKRRKTEATDANSTSSRSHAVLEIGITRMDRNHYEKQVVMGKLALVDLAGSERASETNNRGHQLKDGANINRSLLALANCINALGKRRKKGFVFVPFRNSKLTRLLKDGLCGNSRTAMVATIAAASTQYHHTINTLKYADRAKEIKTHVRRNQGTVQEHIVEYQRMIDALQEENKALKEQLESSAGAAASLLPGALPAPVRVPSEPPWEETSAELNGTAIEQITLFMETEAAERNAMTSGIVAQAIAAEIAARLSGDGSGSSCGSAAAASISETDELRNQLTALTSQLSSTDSERSRLAAKVSDTEAERAAIVAKVAAAPPGEGRERLKLEAAAARRELARVAAKESYSTFQSIIREQDAVITNLWKVLEWAGLSRTQVMDLAAENVKQKGVEELVDGPLMVPGSSKDPGVSSIRLEQLLTGSAAKQFNAQWSARHDAARQSLVTPDVGHRSPNAERRESINSGRASLRQASPQQPRMSDSSQEKGTAPETSAAEDGTDVQAPDVPAPGPLSVEAAEAALLKECSGGKGKKTAPETPAAEDNTGVHKERDAEAPAPNPLSREAAEALLIEDSVPCMADMPEDLDGVASEWDEVAARERGITESQEAAGLASLPQSNGVLSSIDSQSSGSRNVVAESPGLGPETATPGAAQGDAGSMNGRYIESKAASGKGLSVLPQSKSSSQSLSSSGHGSSGQLSQPPASSKLLALRQRLSGSLAASLMSDGGASPSSSPKDVDGGNSGMESVLGKTASPTRSGISKLLSLSRVRRRMDAA